MITAEPTALTSRPALTGTVRRYSLEPGPAGYIRFDESLAEPKPARYFQGPRLLLRELISRQFRLQATLAEDAFITNKSMQSILALSVEVDLMFLLGVINSRLLSWYFLQTSSIAHRDDFPKIVLKETRQLPIPPVDRSDHGAREAREKLIRLVGLLLALNNELSSAHTAADRAALRRQIMATETQVDDLVYRLFDLTEEEIATVEGGVGIENAVAEPRG
jgi:hypothetical protein